MTVNLSGGAQSQVCLPTMPPLVGVVFHHRTLPVAVGARQGSLAIAAPDALQLVARTSRRLPTPAARRQTGNSSRTRTEKPGNTSSPVRSSSARSVCCEPSRR